MSNLAKKFVNALLATIVGVAGLWVAATPSYGHPKYSKQEKKACTFCHPKGDVKQLTDAGKYFQEHDNSLEGYEEKEKGKKLADFHR